MSEPILYHDPMSRGGTTLWMNEELRAPCKIELIDIQKGQQKRASYLGVNPMGKVPTLVHGDVVVTEAAAICAYLADAFPGPGLSPPLNDRNRGIYYRWMFFAPSCVEPMMMDKLSGNGTPEPASSGYGKEEDVLAALRSAIDGKSFVLGDQFSAADVVLGSTIDFAIRFKGIKPEPVFTDYVSRLKERPAARRAEEINAGFIKDLGRS
ncbi:MAG: glutathione S-transferase family protein [Pseudomonadota bacterium]